MSNLDIDPEVIEYEKFKLYMIEMITLLMGGVFAALPFMYFLFKDLVTQEGSYIWLALDLSLAISTVLVYAIYFKFNDFFSHQQWRYVSYFPVLLYVVAISAAPWVFLNTEEHAYNQTMLVMLLGLVGTVTYGLAYYLPRNFSFITLPLISFLINLYVNDYENLLSMAIVLFLLWTSSTIFAISVNRALHSSLIHKLENRQARFIAERANNDKSKFLAAASHDIRQPLQAIHFFIDALKSRNRDVKNEKMFEMLEKSVGGMSDLLNNLLEVSKLEAHEVTPQPQHFNLSILLARIVDEITVQARKKELSVVAEYENEVVFADPILLEQIISNLASNAVRYTLEGEIVIRVVASGNQIDLIVQDTGIGISESEQDTIFEEFFQVSNTERDSEKGLGLGLSIVNRLCLLQDFPLTLDSTLGEGTCFTVSIPQGNYELVEGVNVDSAMMSIEGLTILVIDDNKDILVGIEMMLAQWGGETVCFESAKDTCDFLALNTGIKPDIIISDYRLRRGERGDGAIAQVREYLKEDIPAIIMTGDTSVDDIKSLNSSGFNILYKPISSDDLFSAIHERLNE